LNNWSADLNIFSRASKWLIVLIGGKTKETFTIPKVSLVYFFWLVGRVQRIYQQAGKL
jgi:hypothetical protein